MNIRDEWVEHHLATLSTAEKSKRSGPLRDWFSFCDEHDLDVFHVTPEQILTFVVNHPRRTTYLSRAQLLSTLSTFYRHVLRETGLPARNPLDGVDRKTLAARPDFPPPETLTVPPPPKAPPPPPEAATMPEPTALASSAGNDLVRRLLREMLNLHATVAGLRASVASLEARLLDQTSELTARLDENLELVAALGRRPVIVQLRQVDRISARAAIAEQIANAQEEPDWPLIRKQMSRFGKPYLADCLSLLVNVDTREQVRQIETEALKTITST